MGKIVPFDGFDREIKDFFSKLSVNNTKEWFDSHREYYESEIRDKAKSLAIDFAKVLASENLPYLSDPKVSMFRINRDIRFSKNKDPYKTNIGMIFPYHTGESTYVKGETPVMYFHIDAQQVFVGGGVVSPITAGQRKIRELIADEWDLFREIVYDKDFKENFPYEFKFADPLKKMPKGFPAEHPGEYYLKKRDFGYWGDVSKDSIYEEKLISLLMQKAVLLAPFLSFLHEALRQEN